MHQKLNLNHEQNINASNGKEKFGDPQLIDQRPLSAQLIDLERLLEV